MNRKINTKQIFATLALALALGIAVNPTAAVFAAEEDDIATESVADMGRVAAGATAPKTVDELRELWSVASSLLAKSYNMSAVVANYEVFTEKVDTGRNTSLINAVKAAAPTADVTGWDAKPTYAVYKLAAAMPEAATNDALKKEIDSYLELVNINKTALAGYLEQIFPEKATAIKSMSIDELVKQTEEIPNFPLFKTLDDVANEAFDAWELNPTSYTDVQRGEIYARLASAISAVEAIDPVSADPGILPETSAPEETKPAETKAPAKTPNTGIFGEGENKTAVAMIGGVVALGAVASVVAAHKTMKSKARKTRKF